MIEKLEKGNLVCDIVNQWFTDKKYDLVMSHAVYSNISLKPNKQMDIGKIVILKEEDIETLKEDGLDNPPEVRIFVNTNVIDFIESLQDENHPLVEIAIHRLLEGISYNYENGKISNQKPFICEHAGILNLYGPTAVTEVYRVAIEQYLESLKQED
jgi:hypothetical protein